MSGKGRVLLVTLGTLLCGHLTDFLKGFLTGSAGPLMGLLVPSVVQNLVELLQLPGLEEDRTFQKEIGLKTLVFKAYR